MAQEWRPKHQRTLLPLQLHVPLLLDFRISSGPDTIPIMKFNEVSSGLPNRYTWLDSAKSA